MSLFTPFSVYTFCYKSPTYSTNCEPLPLVEIMKLCILREFQIHALQSLSCLVTGLVNKYYIT